MSQIAEAYVRVRPDTTGFKQDVSRQVSRDLRGVERQLQANNRELSRFTRGALVGTGALRQLGRAAAFASLSFISGAGLVVGLRSSVKAAMEAQASLAQTQNAVEQAGVSWAEYGQRIQDAALVQSQMSGIDDERFQRTFATLLRATGDVNRALEDNALAANVARGANIQLEQAAKIVARAEAGQARGLAQIGVILEKNATRTEILRALNEKFAGSTARFADTAAGAQARFNVALNETQETIGTVLLPVLTDYLNKASEWLNKTENQERIEKRVRQAVDFTTTAVELGTVAVEGMTEAYDLLSRIPGSPVNMFEETRDRARGAGDMIYRVADALGLVEEETRRVVTAQDLAWAAAKRRNLQPALGIFGFGNEINQINEEAAASFDVPAGRPRSPAQTRAQQTATDLARAQASGQRAAITAAVNARMQFVRDTINFANMLLREGRGDTAKLSQTLEQFYGEQESLTGILDRFADEDKRAREDAIEDAQRRAEEWRDANHQIQAAFADARKQGREFHERFREQVRQDAEDARARLEMREMIQGQVLQNQLAAAELKGDTEKGIAAQRAVWKRIIDYYRDLAKHAHYSRLERLRFQNQAIEAQRAFNNLGKQDRQSGGFSLAELFAEAGEQFAQYGSNIGPRGAPLSAQDARGALAQTIKTHNVTVIQHITAPTPISQAMIDARNAARVLQ